MQANIYFCVCGISLPPQFLSYSKFPIFHSVLTLWDWYFPKSFQTMLALLFKSFILEYLFDNSESRLQFLWLQRWFAHITFVWTSLFCWWYGCLVKEIILWDTFLWEDIWLYRYNCTAYFLLFLEGLMIFFV